MSDVGIINIILTLTKNGEVLTYICIKSRKVKKNNKTISWSAVNYLYKHMAIKVYTFICIYKLFVYISIYGSLMANFATARVFLTKRHEMFI